MAGRAEGGQLRPLPAHRPGGREELDVLGVRARPAALDEGHPELVEHPRDAQLVGQRQGDVLALRPVAQRRVVEDDRRSPGAGSVMPVRRRRRRSRVPRRPPSRTPVVPTTTSPSAASAGSARSAVRQPSSSARATAASMASAASSRPSDVRSSIAADRIVPIGFAMSRPAMSGAEPWIGSYRPNVPWSVRRSPSDADGSTPRLPASTEASSERMSPNRFSVTMTSKSAGRRMSSIAQESTSWWLSSTSGYSVATSSATRRHSRERGQHVRLVDRGHDTASSPGQLERQPHDPLDLVLGVWQRVERRRGARLGRTPRSAPRSRSRRSARGR